MHDSFAVIRWDAAGIALGAAGLLWSLSVAAEVIVVLLIPPARIANSIDVPAAGRQLCRTVIHQIKQDSFNGRKSCDASPFFKIEARPLGARVRFFAQVASGAPCA